MTRLDEKEQELVIVAQGLMESLMQMRKIHFKGHPHNGMKHSDVIMVMCIGEKENQGESGMRISDLGRVLKVKNPTVTQVINHLEAMGLVERTLDADDRRAVRISLSEKGRILYDQNRQKFSEEIRGLVDYLGIQDSRELTRIVKKLYFYFMEMNQSDL